MLNLHVLKFLTFRENPRLIHRTPCYNSFKIQTHAVLTKDFRQSVEKSRVSSQVFLQYLNKTTNGKLESSSYAAVARNTATPRSNQYSWKFIILA